MTLHRWERPTETQQQDGVLCILVEFKTLNLEDGRRVPYENRIPYRALSLWRRYQRGGDLPFWISVKDES